MPEVRGDHQTANEESHPKLWEAEEGVHETAFQRQQSTGRTRQFQTWPQVQEGKEQQTRQGRHKHGGTEKAAQFTIQIQHGDHLSGAGSWYSSSQCAEGQISFWSSQEVQEVCEVEEVQIACTLTWPRHLMHHDALVHLTRPKTLE